jgi:hypothetical protein
VSSSFSRPLTRIESWALSSDGHSAKEEYRKQESVGQPMGIASIWTMMPMFSHMYEMPLLTLSPDASDLWDAVAWNEANLKYETPSCSKHLKSPAVLG